VDAALTTLAEALLDGDAQRIDSVPALRALGGTIPVTVAWGSEDRIIPAAQAAAVTAAAPAAESRVIDGAGHMAHMERPAAAQAAIAGTVARAV